MKSVSVDYVIVGCLTVQHICPIYLQDKCVTNIVVMMKSADVTPMIGLDLNTNDT